MANKKDTIEEVTGTITEVAKPVVKEVTTGIKISRFVHKLGFKSKKYMPAGLAVAGAVGVIGTSYLAYKSSKKLEELVTEHEIERGRYEAEDAKQELLDSFDNEFKVEVAKTIALPAIVGLASIVAIGASAFLYQRKITGLTATVGYLTAQSKEIHNRMVETLGEDKTQEIEDTSTYEDRVDENGEKKKVYVGDGRPAQHGDWFSDSPEYVSDDMDYDRKFIQTVEDYANNKLFRNGFILLNDVRDRLGLERTRTGAIVGWTVGETIAMTSKVVNIEEDNKFTNKMFVTWTQPSTIYDLVDYNKNSSGFGL